MRYKVIRSRTCVKIFDTSMKEACCHRNQRIINLLNNPRKIRIITVKKNMNQNGLSIDKCALDEKYCKACKFLGFLDTIIEHECKNKKHDNKNADLFVNRAISENSHKATSSSFYKNSLFQYYVTQTKQSTS